MVEEENEIIEVRMGSESTEKKYKKIEEAIEKARTENKKVRLRVYKSQWKKWKTPKYLLKAFKHAPEVEGIYKEGSDSSLAKFKKNLTEMNVSEEDIKTYLKIIHEMGALQNIVPSLKRCQSSGKRYPDKRLNEILTVEQNQYDVIINRLEQLDVIDPLRNEHRLTEKGEDILSDYIKNELIPNPQEDFAKILDGKIINPRVLYTYLHKDSYQYPQHQGKEEARVVGREIENDIRDIYGLLQDILSNESESSSNIVDEVKNYWSELRDRDWGIVGPCPYYNKHDEKWLVDEDNLIHCIPIDLAEKIYGKVKEKLKNEKEIINILMLINKYNKKPKYAKETISKGIKKYGLTEDDLDSVEKIINQLHEKDNITTMWSKSGEIPYVINDYDAFLDFCADYLLGKEELEIYEGNK